MHLLFLFGSQGVHNKWNDYEKTLGGIQSWFHEQEDKIKQYKMIGQDIGVKQNLKDCKVDVLVHLHFK